MQRHRSDVASSQLSYDLEDAIIKKKAHECVEYILYCCLADRKAIVRRMDLNKNIIKEYSRHFRAIIKLVEEYLSDVFGMRLIDLDRDKAERFGIKSNFEFDTDLCLNNSSDRESSRQSSARINTPDSADTEREFEQQIKYFILINCLSLIFMNGNEMDADTLWDSLKRLDINKDEKRHKYLGDVSKYFTTELVKEGYLEYEQVKGLDPPTFKFKMGYRSKLEVSKKSLLKYVCEMYGGKEVCKPEEWIAQFTDANKDNDEEIDELENETSNNQTTIQTQRSRNTQSANNTSHINNSTQQNDTHYSTSTRSSQRLKR